MQARAGDDEMMRCVGRFKGLMVDGGYDGGVGGQARLLTRLRHFPCLGDMEPHRRDRVPGGPGGTNLKFAGRHREQKAAKITVLPEVEGEGLSAPQLVCDML